MHKLKTIILLALTASLAACSLPGAPAATTPTADIAITLDAARTQAAETVAAEIASQPTATQPPTATLAETATELPSPTTAPSFTPADTATPQPTATNTFIPYTWTPVATATQSDYNCTITSASPAANTEFAARADFDGRWTVKNTGTEIWRTSDVDYRYLSGQEMHKNDDDYDLPAEVDPGESIDIIVDMLAPDSAGKYTTTWGIVRGSRTICALSVTIIVK